MYDKGLAQLLSIVHIFKSTLDKSLMEIQEEKSTLSIACIRFDAVYSEITVFKNKPCNFHSFKQHFQVKLIWRSDWKLAREVIVSSNEVFTLVESQWIIQFTVVQILGIVKETGSQ